MVAFITSPIDTLVQPATRARAPSRTCTVVPTLPCKPNSRCDLRETKLAPNVRWGSRSRDPIGYRDGESLFAYNAFISSTDPTGFATVDKPRTVPKKLQCSLNCCCCPESISLEKGTKVLDQTVGYFKAYYPFKARLTMTFKPISRPYSDIVNDTSDCGFEWWEIRKGSKHPYTGVSDEWKDTLTFPEVTRLDMFDPWFKTSRPQECQDKFGKPSTVPFEVIILDEPGIKNGSGRESLDAYIGIILRANPSCNCKKAVAKLALHVTAGKGFVTLAQLTNEPAFPTPPGQPNGW